MLRNNTRIIAFNPRFSKLVTRECLEKLAGTRKGLTNQQNQHRTKVNNSGSRAATPTVQPLEDDFTQRLGRTTKNARLGRPESGHHQQKSSETSSAKLGHHQSQFEYKRAFRKRSQSLREHRSRQLLSVLHEEEISPQPSSSDTCPPRQSSVDSSNDNTVQLMRTKNAKATGSSFCRFGNQDHSGGITDSSSTSRSSSSTNSGSGGHKRQHWKTRPKGFRSRVVATLVVLKDHYQQLLSSLNGEEVRREYSNLGGVGVNSKYDLQFAEDLDLAQHDLGFEHDHHAGNEYRSVKVRFKRSLSCKI